MGLPGEGLLTGRLVLLHGDGGGPCRGRRRHLEGPWEGEMGLGALLGGLQALLRAGGSWHLDFSGVEWSLSICLPRVQHSLRLPLGDAIGEGHGGLGERWGWRDEVWRGQHARGGQGGGWGWWRCHGRRWRHRLGQWQRW